MPMLSVTKPPEQLGRQAVDTPKKPQTSEEEEAPAPPAVEPSPPLPARSPFRPLSLRRRQARLPEPPPAVERPSTSLVFDASPTTLAAALAKAGAAPDEASLAWSARPASEPAASEFAGSEPVVEAETDGEADTASPS
jgi:hypothetical protein